MCSELLFKMVVFPWREEWIRRATFRQEDHIGCFQNSLGELHYSNSKEKNEKLNGFRIHFEVRVHKIWGQIKYNKCRWKDRLLESGSEYNCVENNHLYRLGKRRKNLHAGSSYQEHFQDIFLTLTGQLGIQIKLSNLSC